MKNFEKRIPQTTPEFKFNPEIMFILSLLPLLKKSLRTFYFNYFSSRATSQNRKRYNLIGQ